MLECKVEEHTIDAAELLFYSRMLRMSWIYKRTNISILNQINIIAIIREDIYL